MGLILAVGRARVGLTGILYHLISFCEDRQDSLPNQGSGNGQVLLRVPVE